MEKLKGIWKELASGIIAIIILIISLILISNYPDLIFLIIPAIFYIIAIIIGIKKKLLK